MPFLTKKLAVSRVNDTLWALESDLVYEGRDDKWTVPAGFETDFASVPRPVQALIPTTGAYTEAAILHDYFCVMLAAFMLDPIKFKERFGLDAPNPGPRDTDAIFRRVMRELGVPPLRRWLIWIGVRWGALINPARRAGWKWDAPLVIIGSLLVSPLVVPLYIITWIALIIDKVLEKL